MERFVVTASLRTPMVKAAGYLTLDALLAAVLFDRLQDVDAAHSSVPLRCSEGLFHASAAVAEHVDKSRIAFVANLRADHSVDPDLIAKNTSGQLHRAIGRTRRRDYGAVMNSYELLTVPTITWYAEGDLQAVQELLRPVQFIGKRRASGFGEVAGWSLEEGSSLDGIVGPFGEPLRPVLGQRTKSVPSRLRPRVGRIARGSLALTSWRLPKRPGIAAPIKIRQRQRPEAPRSD